MRQLVMLVFTLVFMLTSFVAPQVSAGDDFEGNEACENCLEQAYQQKLQCYAVWDYGEGDPDCDAKYSAAETQCQMELCIY